MSKPTGHLAYRFEYADKSAFEVYDDGRAFITFPEVNGHRRAPEEKFGKITNNIRLLMGAVAKPRQDEIARLQEAKRRALYLADERAKEAVTLRATLLNIQALAEQGNPIDSAKLATRCRHALNQQERKKT